jgi:hypothetical protein
MVEGVRILDAMVQSSTVELFQSFGIAMAPTARLRAIPVDYDGCVGASISFTGPAFSGEVILMLPDEVFALVRTGDSLTFAISDWTREMANQLLGRIRNRLTKCRVELLSGLPRSFTGPLPDRERHKKKPLSVYNFRTLRGEVTVILTGIPDNQTLVYSLKADSANEGDVILF